VFEWLIVGAIALLGGQQSSSTRLASTLGTSPPITPIKTFDEKKREWREQWEPTVDRTKWIPKSTAARILAQLPPPQSRLFFGQPFQQALRDDFEAHNKSFLEAQSGRLRAFFESVERNPLTAEQIAACVCMDDNVQVVAAAGSGKTATLVAKAAYLVQEGLGKPDQIIVLTFNAAAARELRERIASRLPTNENDKQVTALTFHAFGMEIIGKAAGKKPSLAPWVETPGQDVEMMAQLARDLASVDPRFNDDWNLFRTVYARDSGGSTDDSGDALKTANGDRVKSKEERLIADWLFYHSVPYLYEQPYQFDTADERHRQYRPDFFYPSISLYHEHFALNAIGMAPSHFEGDYLGGVRWKRDLHRERGTDLFETTSAEIKSGSAIPKLRAELANRGAELRFNPNREGLGSPPLSDLDLAKTLRVFQQHAKSNGLSLADLRRTAEAGAVGGERSRSTLFLALYERVSAEWEKRLSATQSLDFEDLLLAAVGHLESGSFRSPYSVVMADEFQDSSSARVRLLKALTRAHHDPMHLCVVGDDWQGINRFAGADISVMATFERHFEHSTRLTLSETFRFPQELCDISSEFVQANPAQLKKTVSTRNSYKTPLHLYGYLNPAAVEGHLQDQLRQMQEYVLSGALTPSGPDRLSVLILGRYRNDQPRNLARWQSTFGEQLNIGFKTVHGSKGLEADYVMLVNLAGGKRGFPSQIEDDPVLQLAMPSPDTFPFAEERRLFYVALTRAKRQLRIYTSLSQPSRFASELAQNDGLTITPIDAEEMCPKCGSGALVIRYGPFGHFEACSTWPECDFKQKAVQDKAPPT
jgi:DNA helicase-4